MTHYFHEPSSFRGINCKKVPGERARKDCLAWNKLMGLRQKLRKEGRIKEAEELERPYVEMWNEEKEMFGTPKKKKKKKRNKKAKSKSVN